MNERDDPTLKEFAGYYEATEPGYRERAIGWATAIGSLHRNAAANDGINVGINVGINETEGRAMGLIKGNPRLTAASLAAALGVEKRHAERILAALKKKAGLKRRGSRKSGEWYFE